jgi:hypothetical protein
VGVGSGILDAFADVTEDNKNGSEVEKKKTRQGIDNTDVMPILDESKFCSSVF